CIRGLDIAEAKWLPSGIGACSAVTTLDFLPDGKHIISLDGSGCIRLWNADDGNELRSFPMNGTLSGLAVAVLPEKNSVLCLAGSGMARTVRIPDLLEGKSLAFTQNLPIERTTPPGQLCAFGINADGRVGAG